MDFGRHDHAVTSTLDRLPHDLFGLAVGIRGGGVDDVDPGIQCPMDDADAAFVVTVADRAEHHGAQRVRADSDTGSAENPMLLHEVSLRRTTPRNQDAFSRGFAVPGWAQLPA